MIPVWIVVVAVYRLAEHIKAVKLMLRVDLCQVLLFAISPFFWGLYCKGWIFTKLFDVLRRDEDSRCVEELCPRFVNLRTRSLPKY